MGWFVDALEAAGGYYLGKEGIDAARETGELGYDKATDLATDIQGQTEFVPYTVKTGLGTTTTDPSGGVSVALTPEQQAIQNQMFATGGSMLGTMGQPIDQATADIYGQMRALQRPEEERARLALEERMLSQGRLGLGSAAYGGSTPEMLAMRQAEQDAMLKANLAARGQALGEQKQRYDIGSGMMGLGYAPTNQALNALTAGTDVASLAAQGRVAGAELSGQIGQSGIEALMQGEDLANRLTLQQQEGLMNSIFGNQMTVQDRIDAAAVGLDPNTLEPPSIVDQVVDYGKHMFGNWVNDKFEGSVGGYNVSGNSVSGLGSWNADGSSWTGKDPNKMSTSELIARDAANPRGQSRG
tara:strand:- start:101 stop:1168 length:1068 start_codon:yes stop_codon:yes gene_type:complete